MPENSPIFSPQSNLVKESSAPCRPGVQSGASQSTSGTGIKIYTRLFMIWRGSLLIPLHWTLPSSQYSNQNKKLMQTCCVNAILVLCFIFHTCFILFLKSLNSLSSPQRKCVCLWIGTIGEIGIRGKTWLWFGTVQPWDAWLGTKGTWNPWSSALNVWQAETRSHFVGSCLCTSPLALPALALSLGDHSTN